MKRMGLRIPSAARRYRIGNRSWLDKWLDHYGPHRVYLDGVEMKGVFYIDRRRRVMRMHKTDAEGNFVIENDIVPKVEIRWKPKNKLELVPIKRTG